MPGTSGTIAVHYALDHTLVELIGEIDASIDMDNAIALDQATARRARIRVDLTKNTFLDSTGIDFLVRLRRRADEIGVPCDLCNIPDRVTKILDLLGLGYLLGGEAEARAPGPAEQ